MEWKFFPHDLKGTLPWPKKPGDEFEVVVFGATRQFIATDLSVRGMVLARLKPAIPS